MSKAWRIVLSVLLYLASMIIPIFLDSSSIPPVYCACSSDYASLLGCNYVTLFKKICLFGVVERNSLLLAWTEIILLYIVIPGIVIFLFNKFVFKKKK